MLMGLCITVTCIVELPIFAANNWILKKLGVNSVIHITLAVCVIRMVSSIKHAHPAVIPPQSCLCMEALIYLSSICLVITSVLQQSLLHRPIVWQSVCMLHSCFSHHSPIRATMH